MPKIYNVHLYREMRLPFLDIEADSPQQAAQACQDRACDEASQAADNCDGETFSALVDLQGDRDYAQSVIVDFEPERMRKAAPQLLAALQKTLSALREVIGAAKKGHPYSHDELTKHFSADCEQAEAAIAAAESGHDSRSENPAGVQNSSPSSVVARIEVSSQHRGRRR